MRFLTKSDISLVQSVDQIVHLKQTVIAILSFIGLLKETLFRFMHMNKLKAKFPALFPTEGLRNKFDHGFPREEEI